MNLVAAARNQPSYFDEGGQDSTETEVDFVARHVEELIAGQLPEPSAADVSAACEMKGWNQVNVSEGETYNSIVRDFKKLKEVVPSWQQVSSLTIHSCSNMAEYACCINCSCSCAYACP